MREDATAEVTDLLQRLIRNACVNDGSATSGQETKSADLLESYLTGPAVTMRRHEPMSGRANLVVRLEGSDPQAPSLCLMGHTDVVPANASAWSHDPFGGELVDGYVWGRGAVDMLATTASMAVALRRALASGFRPRGTLTYLAVADEESLGTYGAGWLVDHAWDDVRSDYVVTEFGGARLGLGGGSAAKLPLTIAEKGSHWTRLRVRGTAGHGSMPYRTDNAVVKAAEVVRRLHRYRAPTRLHEVWRRFVAALDLPAPLGAALSYETTLELAASRLPVGLGRLIHSSTHTTFAPTIFHGGTKTNVIPDSAEVQFDIRTLPGDGTAAVRAMLEEAIGDLWSSVEVVEDADSPASESAQDTPLWDVLDRVSAKLVPGAKAIPYLIVGATDARFFRRRGVVAYGYGLYSERIPMGEFAAMFHGKDERIDQESLALQVALWENVLREFPAPA